MRLANEGLDSDSVLTELSERIQGDLHFERGQILGSMCTIPDSVARDAYFAAFEKNVGDPGLFPETVALERETISIIAGLLGGGEEAAGAVLTGGTEANLQAMWSAKRRARPEQREVILPDSAHFSFDKAADIMDLKLIKIPVDGRYQMDVARAEAAINERTMAIVGVAGTTGLGLVDPIEQLSHIAVARGIYLHIDAAFGGFVLPFLADAGYPTRAFDFSLPGVSSITIDPHKMGRAAIPAGCLIYRNEELARYSETHVSYMAGGETNQRTITGTRSGASVAAVWAVLKHFGRSGYVRLVRQAMELTYWLRGRLEQIPGVTLVCQPLTNVLGVKVERQDLFKIATELRAHHFAVSFFEGYLRIVVMPHLTRELLAPFLRELEQMVGH